MKKELKKLTCSTDIFNIIGKPYEQNIINLILLICEDAAELKMHQIDYSFYYSDKLSDKEIKKFLGHFSEFNNVVKLQHICEYNTKNIWYSIVTKDSVDMVGRSYYILNEVSEQSLTQAFLEYYSKAKLQIKISSNNKK